MKTHLWDHHVIGIVSTNCFVFGDPKEAIMLDPGGEEAVDLAKDLMKAGVEIKHVLVTHG
jgi:glyoxylase-like metal-dependent hydrolase (beta-lactamase superfamily II)